jgi:hypothetical protein
VSKTSADIGDSLFTEAEMRGEGQSAPRLDFIVGINVAEQAIAIAGQCVRYLTQQSCSRLGVIFPTRGALSRLVSTALDELNIPHNDGLAHFVPGIFEADEWLAWIDFQRSPRLHSFLRFLHALPDSSVLSSKISRQVFGNILCRAYDEILLDDLDLLREFCAHGNELSRAVAEALGNLTILSQRSTLSKFIEQTRSAFAHLGWKQHELEIAGLTHFWSERVDGSFPRALFLRWLEESAVTFRPTRSTEGDNPYARVQLLSVAQAQNQEWSHLILAGCNEGAWPPPPGSDFAREEQIRAFNQNIRQLNQRAGRQGSQGEGHVSVRENHSLYLGPVERRAISMRQFAALLDSTRRAIALAASLVREDAPERIWNPSECFTQTYFAARKQPLTQSVFKNLRSNTPLPPRPASEVDDVKQTLTAFRARRDPKKPAEEYDFSLRSDSSYRPTPPVSVSDLEDMVSSPAIVWMKRYLGVQAPDDLTNPWPAAAGKWVHHWLAGIGGPGDGKLFRKFPASAAIDAHVTRAAAERRSLLHALCDSLGKPVPAWWDSGWENALYLARVIGNKIGSATDWNWMAAELPIGRDGSVKIADGIELQLHGRVDLLLSKNDSPDLNGQDIWIVDYKTNSSRELKKTDLHDTLVKGTNLQVGLYSLAVRALGAAEVGASIVSLGVKNVAPQLSVSELAPHTNIFADLAEMQRTGIFGMKGDIRPAFGYGVPYPLATLQVDPDILEDKWSLTHAALVLEKEEWETW